MRCAEDAGSDSGEVVDDGDDVGDITFRIETERTEEKRRTRQNVDQHKSEEWENVY